jgi:hypothetical protein
MPGFWEYFKQGSDSSRDKEKELFNRQFQITDMWNRFQQQQAASAKDYLGMKIGIDSNMANLHMNVGKAAQEQFNNANTFNANLANMRRTDTMGLLDLSYRNLNEAANRKADLYNTELSIFGNERVQRQADAAAMDRLGLSESSETGRTEMRIGSEEKISANQIDANRYATDKGYQASIHASNMDYSARMRVAELDRETEVFRQYMTILNSLPDPVSDPSTYNSKISLLSDLTNRMPSINYPSHPQRVSISAPTKPTNNAPQGSGGGSHNNSSIGGGISSPYNKLITFKDGGYIYKDGNQYYMRRPNDFRLYSVSAEDMANRNRDPKSGHWKYNWVTGKAYFKLNK